MSDKNMLKDYYADPAFREKVREYKNEKITCKCGVKTSRANLSHHKQTFKHKKWMEENGMNVDDHLITLQARISKLENKIASMTIKKDTNEKNE